MPKRSKSTTDYFREIEGTYNTMDDVEQAIVDLANKSEDLLPIGYSYADLLDWAKQKKWIRKANHKFVFKVA